MSAPGEQIRPEQIAAVLARYELGRVRSVRPLPRGSRQAPKVLVETDRGRFLLKRRAAGRDQPARVAFAHTLLWHLHQAGFPAPALLMTRDTGETMVAHEGRVYEVWEYVEGQRYDGSLEQTMQAGRTLARFHRATRDFATGWQPPEGSYHDAAAVRAGLNAIPSAIAGHESVAGQEAALLSVTQVLHEWYDEAAAQVQAAGLSRWPVAIIHGDWHPGNMLFADSRVVAVFDFDAARRQPLVIDVANGMVQFSILRTGPDPAGWPDYFDEARMRRFLMGYLTRVRLPAAQRGVLVPLMIESLIAEAVTPIAATGSFGWMPGFGVLQTVARKVRWLRTHAGRLGAWMLEDPPASG